MRCLVFGEPSKDATDVELWDLAYRMFFQVEARVSLQEINP